VGAVVGALIVTHTPRMADESTAPPFTREMIRGMHELGTEAERLKPQFNIPVVPLSCCLLADLEECLRWGKAIAEGIRETSKRVVFVASGALSHALVRGPERWPSAECQRLDHRFVELVTQGRAEKLKSFFPVFAGDVDAEMGGRHLALLLGVTGGAFRGHLHAYGPSSGTGNAVVSLIP